MGKYKNILKIVGSLFVVVLFIYFANLSTKKCFGEECLLENKNEIKVEETEENKKENKEENIYSKMDPFSLEEKLQKNEIILLDVREIDEWESGHIKGAIHIPLNDLNIKNTLSLDKNKNIYVYCRSGRRANEAVLKLNNLGFNNVENIGGIIHFESNGGKLVIN